MPPPPVFTASMHCARESRKKSRERERENKGPAQTETMPSSLRARWLLAAHNQAHWVPLPSSPWYPLQTVSCFMSAIRQIMGCSVTDVNDSPACAVRPWCWQRAACMARRVPVQHHLDKNDSWFIVQVSTNCSQWYIWKPMSRCHLQMLLMFHKPVLFYLFCNCIGWYLT